MRTMMHPTFAKLIGQGDRSSLVNRGETLHVAGFNASLGAAMLVPTTRTGDFEGLDGSLGLDFLNQAFPITFDLVNMRLSVGAGNAPAVGAVTIPPTPD